METLNGLLRELIDAAIVASYEQVPDEPDPWVDEAARTTFAQLPDW